MNTTMTRRRFLIQSGAGAIAAAALGRFARAENDAPRERPNILWLTCEDSCAYEFGCYGNRDVKTPNVDALAARGVQFRQAWSTAPQCSPARSTIITGCYATTYGQDQHRKRVRIPSGLFFPQRLRNAGYFCTNRDKTDYNAGGDKDCWDECAATASYESPKRRPSQPFFAVFNNVVSHMTCVRSRLLVARRYVPGEGPDPARATLPPHVPDLPEVRSDYVTHLRAVERVDGWVGEHLKNLERLGLAEDTIVFFYGDNGGCLPRGKGFLYQTGLHVPMVVYVPPKWRHLCRLPAGTRSDRLVGFVDLAPTVLSLAGLDVPAHMQGRAFLGPREAAPRTLQFGLTTNSGDHYVPARAVTDGRFSYIRSYAPHMPQALRNMFQWGMPANLAWDRYVLDGQCARPEWLAPYRPRDAEQLFDVIADPFQIRNLAGDPAHGDTLRRLRAALSEHLRQTGDLGFFPLSMRHKNKQPFYDWVRETRFPLNDLITAAETAGAGDPANRDRLLAFLRSEQPAIRFWGASGFATLACHAKSEKCPEELVKAMADGDPHIAAEAAHAACYLGRPDIALPVLLKAFEAGSLPAYSALEALSLDGKVVPALRAVAGRIEAVMQGYKPDGRDHKQNARSLLVNLGVVPVADLFGKGARKGGEEK